MPRLSPGRKDSPTRGTRCGYPGTEAKKRRGDRSHDARAPGLRPRYQSHIRIVRPTAALRRDPDDILVGILDVAGFAMDAVLRVDLEAWTRGLFDPLIHPGRAVARGWAGIDVVLGLLLQCHVTHD